MTSWDLRAWVAVCVALGTGLVAAGLSVGAPVGSVSLGGFALIAVVALTVANRSRLGSLVGADDDSDDAGSTGCAANPYVTLFLASFVALFVEVMLILYA